MGKTWAYDSQKQFYQWDFGLGRRLTILYLLDKDIWIIHFAKTLLSGARIIFNIVFLFSLVPLLPFAPFISLRFYQRLVVTKL